MHTFGLCCPVEQEMFVDREIAALVIEFVQDRQERRVKWLGEITLPKLLADRSALGVPRTSLQNG